jgi:hypothetical protein
MSRRYSSIKPIWTAIGRTVGLFGFGVILDGLERLLSQT